MRETEVIRYTKEESLFIDFSDFLKTAKPTIIPTIPTVTLSKAGATKPNVNKLGNNESVCILCIVLFFMIVCNVMKKVYILLHDIRSTHNVGSIFRTADALGVDKIYISGYSPTPLDKFGKLRKDIAKVALGAEKTIEWEYVKNPKKLLQKMKDGGVQIVALEQAEDSVDYKKVKIKYPVLFLVGNEVDGISKNILSLCDVVAEIPMAGDKESLNVSVAFGVGLFRILGK